MKFEWDEQKRETNLTKHGLDFYNAEQIFDAPLLVLEDNREDYGEMRWIGLGLLENRVVVLVYTEPDVTTVRFISLRKALPQERKRYEQYLSNRLGAG